MTTDHVDVVDISNDDHIRTALSNALEFNLQVAEQASVRAARYARAIAALDGEPPQSTTNLPNSARPKDVTPPPAAPPPTAPTKRRPTPKIPCPNCARPMAPQGLPRHLTTCTPAEPNPEPDTIPAPLKLVTKEYADAQTPLTDPAGLPTTPRSTGADALPPANGSSTRAPQVPGRHFECDDCPESYPTTRQLIHHTISVHDRQPRATERIPREAS